MRIRPNSRGSRDQAAFRGARPPAGGNAGKAVARIRPGFRVHAARTERAAALYVMAAAGARNGQKRGARMGRYQPGLFARTRPGS